jgi:hypothetical protein
MSTLCHALGIFSETSDKSMCPGSTQPFEMNTRIFLGVKTALLCRLSRNPGALTFRTPQGHVGLFRGYLNFSPFTLCHEFGWLGPLLLGLFVSHSVNQLLSLADFFFPRWHICLVHSSGYCTVSTPDRSDGLEKLFAFI